MGQACNPSYFGSWSRRIISLRPAWATEFKICLGNTVGPCVTINKLKSVRGLALHTQPWTPSQSERCILCMRRVRGSGLSWTLEGPSLDLAHLCSSLSVILSLSLVFLTTALEAQDEGEIVCDCYLSVCYEEHAGLGLHRVIAAGPCDLGKSLLLFEPLFPQW